MYLMQADLLYVWSLTCWQLDFSTSLVLGIDTASPFYRPTAKFLDARIFRDVLEDDEERCEVYLGPGKPIRLPVSQIHLHHSAL